MVCCLVIVVWALRCLFCCVGVDFGLWCWSLRSVVLDWCLVWLISRDLFADCYVY